MKEGMALPSENFEEISFQDILADFNSPLK